jgi:glycosyltransferase involved in cell wall biosynthesis
VDVVIPVYNGAAYIAEAIESVFLQTISPQTVIVVDDCSTDETPAVLDSFGSSIRVVRHEKNRGLPATRNTGIKAGDSALIAFLDADDKWAEGKLEKQVNEFREKPEIGLCYTDMIECDSNLSPIRNRRKFKKRSGEFVFHELYIKAFPIPPSTVMVSREVFDVCGLFDESMLKAQDYECWLRIAMKYPVSCIDEPLCLRRNNPGSITNTSNLKKSVYYTFRAFELCGAAASVWGVQLPVPVEERKKLYLYRALRESIAWGRPDDAVILYNKLKEAGGLDLQREIALQFLKFLIGFKNKIKPLIKA